jgi:putative DNA-invertase from lambdoid prophage Rac
MTQTILYARVSTVDQNLAQQLTQAEKARYVIDEVVADRGVSGVSTRLLERTEGKRLFNMLRRGDTLVVRWVDWLGRNYKDLTDTIRFFMKKGVVIRTMIDNQTFDGSTDDTTQMAARDALIAFMAATAQAQAEAIKEAQRAGIEANKGDTDKYRGKKPSYNRKTLEMVVSMLDLKHATSAITKA